MTLEDWQRVSTEAHAELDRLKALHGARAAWALPEYAEVSLRAWQADNEIAFALSALKRKSDENS